MDDLIFPNFNKIVNDKFYRMSWNFILDFPADEFKKREIFEYVFSIWSSDHENDTKSMQNGSSENKIINSYYATREKFSKGSRDLTLDEYLSIRGKNGGLEFCYYDFTQDFESLSRFLSLINDLFDSNHDIKNICLYFDSDLELIKFITKEFSQIPKTYINQKLMQHYLKWQINPAFQLERGYSRDHYEKTILLLKGIIYDIWK